MESQDILEKLEINSTLYNQLVKRARRMWDKKNRWTEMAEREQDPEMRRTTERVASETREAFWTIVEILKDAGYNFTQIMKDAGLA